jgi:hypothetical protein
MRKWRTPVGDTQPSKTVGLTLGRFWAEVKYTLQREVAPTGAPVGAPAHIVGTT